MMFSSPLNWPHGWPRTPKHRQDPGGRFTARGAPGYLFEEACRLLLYELRLLGARDVVISTNHRTVPVNGERVDDEGVAIYFKRKGKEMAVARDYYTTAANNLRSLFHAIKALRTVERHGGGAMMERAFTGFAALPPPASAATARPGIFNGPCGTPPSSSGS